MIHGKRECEVGSCVHYELDDSSVPHGLDMANYSVSSRVRCHSWCVVTAPRTGGLDLGPCGAVGEHGGRYGPLVRVQNRGNRFRRENTIYLNILLTLIGVARP
jgi:hypothetical protein